MFIQPTRDGHLRLVTSASDLTAASQCEFAFLRRVDARLGRNVSVPPQEDTMLERAARLGDAHEERVLSGYLGQYGERVVEIARADARDESALLGAESETLAALRSDAQIVFQATFFDPEQRPADDVSIAFIGYADFLARRSDGSWQVQDTKLARSAKVSALLQVAAYAEQLERLRVPVSPDVVLILGDGSRSTHQLIDIAPVFRSQRERLHTLLLQRARAVGADGRRESAEPIAWSAPGIKLCGRCEVCEEQVQQHRDVLLIAGVRLTQRERLRESGLRTIDDVAEAHARIRDGLFEVSGVSRTVLEKLALQARLQIESENRAAPAVAIDDPTVFAALPQPNPGDLFFDFEGDPLYREPGPDESARWNLDYLFGWVDASERYTAVWAHNLDEERRALEQFLEFVAERRRQYPGMHIYHYAPYERTHLLSIAARHGVGESEVDQLLREHVLVDLYTTVRRGLRVGSRSYSIKKLEPLYMGDEFRDESGVTSGAESVVEYAEARALLLATDPASRAEGAARLESIADYNRYDCVSTLRLRDWLLRLGREANIELHTATERDGDRSSADGETEPALELSPLAAALAQHASHASDLESRRAAALAGSAIDYYEREQKSFWWAHYARLVDPVDEWADTRDVMIVDSTLSTVEQAWTAPQGRQKRHRRLLRLRGTIAPGSSFSPDSEVHALYEFPAPFESQRNAAPGARGCVRVTVIERHADGVTIEETRSDEVLEYPQLPVALTPGPPPRVGSQKGAIEEWGSALAHALDSGETFTDPVFDIMRRVPPRMQSGANGERLSLVAPNSSEALDASGGLDDHRTIGAVVASLRKVDHSVIPVQGPPGTGKTYLAARVIRTLVEEDGWHIGVVAQSHKVIENVLERVVEAGLDASLVGKTAQRGKPRVDAHQPNYTVLKSNGHAQFLADHRAAGRGAVIGGTAWDMSNSARIGRKALDLLVIDEAGQFSLAPTIAASVAAERLLLLGDPQQLPQVSQGSHLEPVDTSALGWLLGDNETLSDEAGYFLAETRRMRPELTAVVSELAYGGRLHAHPSTTSRNVVGAGPAGLSWHPVTHHGNSTDSPEEAAVVTQLVQQFLSATASVPGADSAVRECAVTENDLIVVAAYNAQVETVSAALSAAGYGAVRVGTVDRFQGQEALIAIVTLAASSAEDVPRGLEFLLMRNRLNVAISRAQWAAHLVSSDRLGNALPATSEALAALSGYLRLTERGSHH